MHISVIEEGDLSTHFYCCGDKRDLEMEEDSAPPGRKNKTYPSISVLT